ncbi:YeiH family protein [Sulfurisoma sediminicola]|uniref:Putative integral membrane protein (TIGR00698 family) n=1 Tax=Sulfurisoma sediminicola TaxID=1381557 RepID=A0A497XKW2_9PROT|nr:putative sulfate exporter family transporter [Sulfurisoma sediminicola]RLJ68040.1 putative integral membrane protein (TIGR00698 family) [Sulfurisoma sediminicola]
MIYTKKSPALLIIGVMMLLWGWLNASGGIDGMQRYLQKSAYSDHMKVKEKFDAELRVATEIATAEGKPAPVMKMPKSKFDAAKASQANLSYIFGGIATVLGLLIMVWTPKEGQFDYYLSIFPGMAFILLIAFIVRWGLDPIFANWGKDAKDTLGFDFAHIFNLNYVVLGIVIGIVIVNVFKIPAWAANGVRTARFFLKTGVILLGALYSATELAQLGGLSVIMIGIFVLGSVGVVLYMGKRMKSGNSMTAVLSAGMGVCGVSATVAASPVVNAKAGEIAYTIGTILIWGVGCMFLFPTIGHMLNMGPVQFGAWAGTGILNSAQVAGAALAFDPHGIETLKVAEIFNITRVLFLPIIVLWLAAWYVKHEAGAQKVDLGKVLLAKFPLFVLGFILLFILSTLGVFTPSGHYQGKYFSSEEIKEDKLLKGKETRAIEGELARLKEPAGAKQLQDHFAEKAINIGQRHATPDDAYKGLADLIANKKMTTREQETLLAAVGKMKGLDAVAASSIDKASKAAYHSSKTISAFRDWLAWLFAFGLIGLGMQITMAALKQAGGTPLIIGGVVGTGKAVGSLIVVLLFVKEFI